MLATAGCFECDLAEITADIAGADATRCSEEGATHDEGVDWQCLYSAIEEGYSAWVLYKANTEDLGPFPPRTLGRGVVYDGADRVWLLRHLDSCSIHQVSGPCITEFIAEPTGDISYGPETDDGLGRINVEYSYGMEDEVLCQ